MPGHPELASLQPPRPQSCHSATATKTVSALDIPGFRDDAVRDYVRYLQGKVRSKKHRDEFEKAGKIVLDNFLDLEQVYQEQNANFFCRRMRRSGYRGSACHCRYNMTAEASTQPPRKPTLSLYSATIERLTSFVMIFSDNATDLDSRGRNNKAHSHGSMS